jgi:hypothetical protein
MDSGHAVRYFSVKLRTPEPSPATPQLTEKLNINQQPISALNHQNPIQNHVGPTARGAIFTISSLNFAVFIKVDYTTGPTHKK